MKNLLISLSLLALTAAAQAEPLKVSTGEKKFETFSSILSTDVNAAEKPLRIYMEDSMGCSQVRLDLNIIREDGFFHAGIFTLDLKADCDQSISDLTLDFDPLCSAEYKGEAGLTLRYTKSGQNASKRIIIKNSQSCQE